VSADAKDLLLALQTLRSWFKRDITRGAIGEVSSGELVLDGCPNHLRSDLQKADAVIAKHFQEHA
jgi:hypothetical protein